MRDAKPTAQLMTDIPKYRLSIKSPPFYNTGIDYLGPLYVKVLQNPATRWECNFTCVATRDVHLELSPSLEKGVLILLMYLD